MAARARWKTTRRAPRRLGLHRLPVWAAILVVATASLAETVPEVRKTPDPAARLLSGSDASEYWTLYVELESGHRITQRFLLTNAGPGEHTAVAVGHLVEPGRAPYRYENGRRRARWTLSEDRLFFDIAASHLDLHRPRGELRITKDDIEIRLFFEFAASDLAASVPSSRLPPGYAVDVLAVAAPTSGTLRAPWMTEPKEVRGRTWMAHTWTDKAEAQLLDRRIDLYAGGPERAFYGLQLRNGPPFSSHWFIGRNATGQIIESPIHVIDTWTESPRPQDERGSSAYPLPGSFEVKRGAHAGVIAITREWLRYDPLGVIPNPFRWFIRKSTEPQEVWADARIDVTLFAAPGSPSLPTRPGADEGESRSNQVTNGSQHEVGTTTVLSADRDAGQGHGVQGHDVDEESESTSNSERETANGSAARSVKGVASITFMNPIDRP